MSFREDVVSEIDNAIGRLGNEQAPTISPTVVAELVAVVYQKEINGHHVRWAAIEHFKDLARRRLAKMFSPTDVENITEQEDMFSDGLQERYPIPVAQGDEPKYKLRVLLSDEESEYNLLMLRKKAISLNKHADAFEADWDARRNMRGAA